MSKVLEDITNKALVLHYGVRLSSNAISELSKDYLSKRRVYSNYDDESFLPVNVPPEVIFPNTNLVATVILKNDSPLLIDYSGEKFYLYNEKEPDFKEEVSFYSTPKFYGQKLSNGEYVEQYITKLFGHSLGLFGSTSCYFAQEEQVCKFCSISENKGRPIDIHSKIYGSCVLEAINIAVSCDNTINDIFISGGVTSADFDKNFIYYSDLAIAIKEMLKSLGSKIEVTLNTYPPKDINLLGRLKETDINVMISIETITDDDRSFICPGKSQLFNKTGVDNLFKKLVENVGYGHVLAFVMQGIQSNDVILEGVEHFARIGVCVVVPVLHVDPGTWVYKQNMKPPSPKEIIQMVKSISMIFHKYNMNTSISYGGRSSLDSEASLFTFE